MHSDRAWTFTRKKHPAIEQLIKANWRTFYPGRHSSKIPPCREFHWTVRSQLFFPLLQVGITPSWKVLSLLLDPLSLVLYGFVRSNRRRSLQLLACTPETPVAHIQQIRHMWAATQIRGTHILSMELKSTDQTMTLLKNVLIFVEMRVISMLG